MNKNSALEPLDIPNSVDTDHWVDCFGDSLFRYAFYRVNDRASAEDLVQETFVAALNSAGGFASRSSQKTWLMGILKHKIIDHFRKKFTLLTSSTEMTEDIDESFSKKGEWRRQLDEWSELPDSDLSRNEFSQILKVCLSHLPDTQRDVFVLREIDGFETDEICKDCSMTSTKRLRKN